MDISICVLEIEKNQKPDWEAAREALNNISDEDVVSAFCEAAELDEDEATDLYLHTKARNVARDGLESIRRECEDADFARLSKTNVFIICGESNNGTPWYEEDEYNGIMTAITLKLIQAAGFISNNCG